MKPTPKRSSTLRRARARHAAAFFGFVWFWTSMLAPKLKRRGLRTRALRLVVQVRRRTRGLRRMRHLL